MTLYKCGHKSKPVFLDDSPLSIVAYLDWKDSVGYNGTKKECWECYCKRINKRKK